MSTSASDLWGRLDTEGIEASGFLRLRFAEVRSCPTYAARRTDSGLEVLMLEVEKTVIPQHPIFPNTRGFSVSAESMDPGRKGRSRLLLSLAEDRYRDVFVSLAEDVLHQLESSASPREAVSQMFSRLDRWQTFLKQHGPEGLSVPERRGLFGELFLLKRLVELGLSPALAIEAWTGPTASSHDFQLRGGSIEVKTTAAVTPTGFRVSNAKQLDDTSVPALLLSVVVLDESESAGRSLPDLIGDIQRLLADSSLYAWEAALTSAGYLRVQSQRYERPLYLVRDLRLYRIGDGFPRLLESDLPEGVSEVGYTVALGALTNFRCDESEIAEMIERNNR